MVDYTGAIEWGCFWLGAGFVGGMYFLAHLFHSVNIEEVKVTVAHEN